MLGDPGVDAGDLASDDLGEGGGLLLAAWPWIRR